MITYLFVNQWNSKAHFVMLQQHNVLIFIFFSFTLIPTFDSIFWHFLGDNTIISVSPHNNFVEHFNTHNFW